MRRIMLLGVAAIAACAAALAVASPARSGFPPPPFQDDWYTASAYAWTGGYGGFHGAAYCPANFLCRQVALENTDVNHMLTHTSSVQVNLLSTTQGIITPPLVSTAVTLEFVDFPWTTYHKVWTYMIKTAIPTTQPVGIKIVANHVKQYNDPPGGMQAQQVGVVWFTPTP